MANVYTVGQVNGYIKNMFVNDFFLNNLCVGGEVSNVKYHSSGHIYFSLKDSTSSINCVMFKGNRTGLRFVLENGQKVIVKCSVGTYEREGKYQVYAREIKKDGTGDLHIEYEKLKQKLYEEGLFDFEHKKDIPPYPKKVGIVTASTGAAIEDIKNIAKRRNPYVQLILYPAKVQGEGAAKTIVKGIKGLDAMGVDTIIVGRGGGSIEDLWAFNEEIVARAIYEAKTPIISGTGHEIDNTIADYVADLRAPTPSAACELAMYDVVSTIRQLDSYKSSMNNILSRRVKEYSLRLDNLDRHLRYLSPSTILDNNKMYLDELQDRLDTSLEKYMTRINHRWELLTTRLHGLSPTAKLVGGFGYIYSGAEAVDSVEKVTVGDNMTVTIHDGTIEATVTNIKENEDGR